MQTGQSFTDPINWPLARLSDWKTTVLPDIRECAKIQHAEHDMKMSSFFDSELRIRSMRVREGGKGLATPLAALWAQKQPYLNNSGRHGWTHNRGKGPDR